MFSVERPLMFCGSDKIFTSQADNDLEMSRFLAERSGAKSVPERLAISSISRVQIGLAVLE